ncbi:uncharacterized protein LOC134773906 [Penaeus indicus]|uniref:uncharacterized protein LOC134773906 n=1 Tax=Penaeus indicus TaxID=29960 RepID=UPI00300C78D6
MTGKSKELVDMMERRKLDILCVQETRWKGSEARELGAGYKLFYHGEVSGRNGVGVVVKEKHINGVFELIPREERLIIGADFNGQSGQGNGRDERVMGKFGYGTRNVEGQDIVDFAHRMEMAVINITHDHVHKWRQADAN